MKSYHLRRAEKGISDPTTLEEIIRGQKYLDIAMCKDNTPYLVTLSYAYDATRRCCYFHCASAGKKIDYLQANPIVWGQILEDHGYDEGKCNHAFRSVHFQGQVTFVDDNEEKLYALNLMIEQLESHPQAVKNAQINPSSVKKVTIGKIHIETLSGKTNGIKI